MKMRPEHYKYIKYHIFRYLNEHPEVGAGAALGSMRLRWDIYWHSGGALSNASEYHYLDDNNIDTALKSILKEWLSMNPITGNPMSKREATLRVIIRYAREAAKGEGWNWERVAEIIRRKDLDYPYYESFFTFYRNGVPAGYDWVNGNDKWKLLLWQINHGYTTKNIIARSTNPIGENPMKKKLMVHPEVIDYLNRVRKDRGAGHADAEEYWKGAAAGALIAGNTNPRVKRCDYPMCNNKAEDRILLNGKWVNICGKHLMELYLKGYHNPVNPEVMGGFDEYNVEWAKLQVWKKMCEWQGVDPKLDTVDFSSDNPYLKVYFYMDSASKAATKRLKKHRTYYGENNPSPILPSIVGGLASGIGMGLAHAMTAKNPRRNYVKTTCRRCGVTIRAFANERRPLCVSCGRIEHRNNPFFESLVSGIGLGTGWAAAAMGAKYLTPKIEKWIKNRKKKK